MSTLQSQLNEISRQYEQLCFQLGDAISKEFQIQEIQGRLRDKIKEVCHQGAQLESLINREKQEKEKTTDLESNASN